MLSETSSQRGPDPLGRYYTMGSVGKLLIDEMNLENPKVIVDFGVGQGALTMQAIEAWSNAKFITVDIDKQSSSSSPNKGISKRVHFIQDVLNLHLSKKIGIELGSVDAAICNPPYIKPKWQIGFQKILEEAGLSNVFASMKDVRADVLFIAQNLRFLKNFGKLGLIIPDGVIAGNNYMELRKNLILNHRIESVIELPRSIFKSTEAKAHILILTKSGKSNKTIQLKSFNTFSQLQEVIEITQEEAFQRMDYTYYKNTIPLKTFRKLKEVTLDLKRGRLNSRQVKNSPHPIFHSTNFPPIILGNCPEVPRTFIFTEPLANLQTSFAKKGDILVCRVGKNLQNKICYVSDGYVALSDCVYKLTVLEAEREYVMKTLCSESGKTLLSNIAHGVSAKYISMRDLKSFPL